MDRHATDVARDDKVYVLIVQAGGQSKNPIQMQISLTTKYLVLPHGCFHIFATYVHWLAIYAVPAPITRRTLFTNCPAVCCAPKPCCNK